MSNQCRLFMKRIEPRINTKATASLEAIIMISAQETVIGQVLSKAPLIQSTTSYDLNESMFDNESFSPSIVGVSSSNKEASHPC